MSGRVSYHPRYLFCSCQIFKIHLNLNQICWPHVSTVYRNFRATIYHLIKGIFILSNCWNKIFLIIFYMKWKFEIFNTKWQKLYSLTFSLLATDEQGPIRQLPGWILRQRGSCVQTLREIAVYFSSPHLLCIFHQLQCCKYMYPML